jgi:flagellar motor protein MotB
MNMNENTNTENDTDTDTDTDTDMDMDAYTGINRLLEEETAASPSWMPLFFSLMLVLLTLFIFLITYAETDKEKIRIFREQFQESLLLSGAQGRGARSIVHVGTQQDPLNALINRMKSEGINKKLMDEFLTLKQIKDLEVMAGKTGVSVILPEVAVFEPGKNQLTGKAVDYLAAVSYLVSELPYLVEIKGFSPGTVPTGYIDALEFSARRALLVYNFFLSQHIPSLKLKVSGCGDAFAGSEIPQNKVEIIFKSPEL